jgi:nucleotide-binding universal stress UspA family protein
VSIKDILVHIDPSDACAERVRLTIRIANRFGAFVTGVFVLPSPAMLIAPDSGAAAVTIASYLADLEDAAATTGREFLERLHAEGLNGAWHLEHGAAAFNIARRARPTDLVVIGQNDPDFPTVLSAPEDVILSCGLPVLVVPYAGRFDSVGANAAIAWNNGRESARAAHDALPLLLPQKKVTVVSVNPEPDDGEIRDDLVFHLVRHGLDTQVETHVTKRFSPAELMLSRVADNSFDLVVMGAYGHSRLRETILGGMTRDMLRSMTVPVLMAH